jgi:uncharacterized membrane protein YjgN (DUF898 family)
LTAVSDGQTARGHAAPQNNPPHVPAAAVPGQTSPVRMRFSGEERILLSILLRGGMLQILTLGFYRFWLITDIRRHVWMHTEIDDHSFEYLGDGKELLLGFLTALTVLVPIYVAYTLLAVEIERLVVFGSLALVGVTYGLMYFAFYRARRYRISRTAFRGMRLGMSGSGWAYAGRALIWDFLTLLTIGFAYPSRTAALARYKMRHTHYGTLAGSFVGSGWAFFKRVWWIWAGFLALFFGASFIAAEDPTSSWAMVSGALVALAISALVPIIRAVEFRWWLDGLRLGTVAAASSLRIRSIFWCYARASLWVVAIVSILSVSVGLTALIARNVIVLLAGGPHDVPDLIQLPATVAGATILATLYLGSMIAIDIAYRIALDRGIWEACVNSVTLTNPEALDEARADGGRPPSGFGEGMLDALDVGAGF